jgi:putative hemolysin
MEGAMQEILAPSETWVGASLRYAPTSSGIDRGRFRARFAATPQDLDAVLRLRFSVFNLEMGEGLAASHATGRDEDEFDAVCDHLMVEDRATGEVVGTYRMQTAEMAHRGRGFYAAGEFDLGGLPGDLLRDTVEIGRACIARHCRNRHVLFLLWKGLASYLTWARKHALFGCCSLTSQDPAAGSSAYRQLTLEGHLHASLRVEPLPGLECLAAPGGEPHLDVDIPVLFRTYLRHGAKICGPPAIDRAFRTIDFLSLLDTRDLDPDLRELYFGKEES